MKRATLPTTIRRWRYLLSTRLGTLARGACGTCGTELAGGESRIVWEESEAHNARRRWWVRRRMLVLCSPCAFVAGKAWWQIKPEAHDPRGTPEWLAFCATRWAP